MLAKFLQKTVFIKGLLIVILLSSYQVQARTAIFLELDVDWHELYFGGEITSADWGGMNTQDDVWQVVIEFDDFNLTHTQAIFERAQPTRPPFVMKVYSNSHLPVGVYPAVGHTNLLSDDVLVKQTHPQDVQAFGALKLNDYLRGEANSEPATWWYFRRSIAGLLDAGVTPDNDKLVSALDLVGRKLLVSEEFSQRPVASHLKNGIAVVSDVAVINLDDNTNLHCRYEIENDWGSGFTANIFLKNEGVKSLYNWVLELDFIDEVQISHNWSGEIFSESGHAHIRNMVWNDVIEPGQEISLGLNGLKNSSQSAAALISSVLCR